LSRLIPGAILAVLVVLAAARISLSAEKTAVPAGQSTPAPTTSPHLVIDLQHRKILLKLADVILREYAITTVNGLQGDTIPDNPGLQPTADGQTVRSVHLISAAEAIPQLELNVIAEETALGPDRLQRYIPREMVLVTSGNLRIHIETECANARTFFWQRVLDDLRWAWYGLLGRDSVRLGMSADDAMSLYGVVRCGSGITLK
jgi:hypothetical protein